MLSVVISLKSACLSAVAAAICRKSDLANHLPDRSEDDILDRVVEIEERKKIISRYKEEIAQLRIPKNIEELLIEKIKFILIRLSQWIDKNFYNSFFNVSDFLLEFEVHNTGEIDVEKTVRKLLKTLSLEKRFSAACYYAIEDEIVYCRQLIKYMKFSDCENHPMSEDPVFRYWYQERDLLPDSDEIDYLLFLAINDENISAIKFFFNKLPENDRQEFVDAVAVWLVGDLRTLLSKSNGHDVVFFLRKLNEANERLLYKEFAYNLLRFFLMCSSQDYFPIMLPKLLNYASENQIYDLLYYAAIADTLDDRDFQDSFQLVWDQCDLSTRKEIIEKIINYNPSTRSEIFMSSLSVHNFVKLLQIASPEQRQKLKELKKKPEVNFYRLYCLRELGVTEE